MNNKVFGWIYIIENKVNGLCNVGKAINYEKRMRQHLHSKEGKPGHHYFDRAYQKYGPDTFWHWKLPCKSKEEMIEWEKYFIAILNCVYPNGYNLTNGGEGGDTFTNNPNKEKIKENIKNSWTDKQRRKQREKLRNLYLTSKGKKLAKKHSEKMSGKNHWNYGKKGYWAGKKRPEMIGPNHFNFGKMGYWKGKKRPDISENQKGKSIPEDVKTKIRKFLKDFYQTLKGKKQAKEHSEKMKRRFVDKNHFNTKTDV